MSFASTWSAKALQLAETSEELSYLITKFVEQHAETIYKSGIDNELSKKADASGEEENRSLGWSSEDDALDMSSYFSESHKKNPATKKRMLDNFL